MADPITPEVSQRICKHMNEDHADAIALYAKVYGNTPNATAAEMASIDPEGMDLITQVNGEAVSIRVAFDHVLQDSEDAHQTLIAMVRQARQPQP
ncbi:putative heme iron utilization protein [Leptolyngbyaceae cyanobacterium JSC-12]|nr:putative heme iron utilization protein [Leptolyngbyaceae cyanobacterium JSC-12]